MSKIAQPSKQRNKQSRSTSHNGEVVVRALQQGRYVVVGGMIQIEDGTWLLKKYISGKDHFLRKMNAIAWSVEVLAEARRQGCTSIRVYNKDTGDVYDATMQHFLDRSRLITLNGADDPQRMLPLTHWRVNGRFSDYEQLTQYRVPRDERPQQMTLIEMVRKYE